MRRLAGGVAVAGVLALAPVTAGANDWRVSCSTLTMDEAAVAPLTYQFNGTSLQYLAGSASVNPLVGRISPVNTSINPELPGWTTLQLSGFDQGAGTIVSATLRRVRTCNGQIETICTATLVSPTQTCAQCNAAALGAIDFANFTYFVEVTVDRSTSAEQPRCDTLRLF
ncbi:MAG TPA: hypothetical protein VF310_03805 [Vicinamibacteria bacterium]